MTTDAGAAPTARRRVIIPTLGALLVTIAGGFSYVLLLDVPWMRTTGLPALLVMLIGSAWGAWLTRRHRSWLSAAAVTFSGTATIVFIVYMYFMMLPQPVATVALNAAAPDLALVDHTGAIVSLTDVRDRGPVLLVFYRGFW